MKTKGHWKLSTSLHFAALAVLQSLAINSLDEPTPWALWAVFALLCVWCAGFAVAWIVE